MATSSAITPTMSVHSPEFPSTAAAGNYRRKPANFMPRNRPIKVSLATKASEKPEIELEFVGPKPGDDGIYPRESASAVSGEKLLRNIMADNKIELYAAYGKVMNCGGGGSCGTCIVEIIEGKDLLNERTNAELKYLKKEPLLISYNIPVDFITVRLELQNSCLAESRAMIIRLIFCCLKFIKPESWRLACQTIVGNKENSGKVVVQRMPQWKK